MQACPISLDSSIVGRYARDQCQAALHPPPTDRPGANEQSSAWRSCCSRRSPRTWRWSSSRASTASSSPGTRSRCRRRSAVRARASTRRATAGPRTAINILVMGLDRRRARRRHPDAHRHDLHRDGRPEDATRRASSASRATCSSNIPAKRRRDLPGPHQHRVRRRRAGQVPGRRRRAAEGGAAGASRSTSRSIKYVIIDFKGFESDHRRPRRHRRRRAGGGLRPVLLGDGAARATTSRRTSSPGRSTWTASTALAYARIRFSSDDLDRIQRQQRVIFAAIEKAKSLNVLTNAPVALGSKYKDAIQTDISDVADPGLRAAGEPGEGQHPRRVARAGDGAVHDATGRGGAHRRTTKRIHEDRASRCSRRSRADVPAATETPEPVRVQVQNGTGIEGLATRVVAFIAAQGLSARTTSTPPTSSTGRSTRQSEIIDLNGTNQPKRATCWRTGCRSRRSRCETRPADEKAAMSGDQADIVVVLGSATSDYDERRSSRPAAVTRRSTAAEPAAAELAAAESASAR